MITIKTSSNLIFMFCDFKLFNFFGFWFEHWQKVPMKSGLFIPNYGPTFINFEATAFSNLSWNNYGSLLRDRYSKSRLQPVWPVKSCQIWSHWSPPPPRWPNYLKNWQLFTFLLGASSTRSIWICIPSKSTTKTAEQVSHAAYKI